MTRAILFILAIALTGCAAMGAPSSPPTATPLESATPSLATLPAASPTPSPEPTLPEWFNRTPSPECVAPPPDLMTVIFTEHKVECYGRTPLTLSGVIDGIGTYDPLLRTEPAWLATPQLTLQAIIDEAGSQAQPITLAAAQQGVARPSSWSPPDLWIVAHPASGIELGDYMLRAVTVVGHFDDPAAMTCHYLEDYSALGFPPEDAVGYCRAQFVVTEIELLGT
jgi:hypothetical protein